MRVRLGRFWTVVSLFVIANAVALLWMREELAQAREASARVLVALPDHDVDQADRFALIFDTPVASPYIVGRRLDATPFRLTPGVPGEWIWATRDQLEYRLEKPLAPGRVYRLELSDQFTMQTGYRLAGRTSFAFASRRLELEACALEAADDEWISFDLEFNQPVDPRDLLRHIEVQPELTNAAVSSPEPASAGDSGGGAAEAARIDDVVALETSPAEAITLQVRRIPACRQLRVRLDGDLAGAGGTLALGHEEVHEIDVPRAFALINASVDTPGIDGDVTVYLRFSRRPDRHQRVPDVEITPPVAHVSRRWNYRGLTLEGPFECGQRYRVAVDSGTVSLDGALLGGANQAAFEVPDREPSLRLSYAKGILSPAGNLALDLEAVNVDAVDVSLSRVFENNLVSHVQGTRLERTARDLPARTIRLDAPQNEPTKISLPLRELIDEPLGIYSVTVRSADSYWTRSRSLVTVSDLALTVKRESGSVLVWVTSVRTAQPLGGVTIRAHSDKNQILGEALTGADGTAHLPLPADGDAGRLLLVSARLAGDLNYIRPDQRPWVIDGVDTAGRAIPSGYDVMLYPERGAFRPGDVVHLTGIVRGPRGEVPDPFPIALRVERPDGKEVADLTVNPAEGMQGVFQVDWTSSVDGQTGAYRFSAHLPGSSEVLGRTRALVEAFVPVRIEVEAEPTRDLFAPGERVTVDVAARYLFDQPAADLQVILSGRLHAVPHRSAAYPDHVFAGGLAHKPVKIDIVKGKLDADGHARLAVKLPELDAPALWRADLSASVVEPGGRSVSRSLSTMVDNSGRHVGARLNGGLLQKVGEMLSLDWVICTARDLPAEPGPLELSLVRVETDWFVQVVNGWPTWKTREREVPVLTRSLAGREVRDAAGRCGFVCPVSGRYRVGLRDVRSGNTTRLTFEATTVGADPDVLAVRSPERLDLVMDQESHEVGDTVRLLVRGPFAGTLLLSLETDHVIWHTCQPFAGDECLIEVPLTGDLRGGAFLTGSLVRPIDPASQTWQPVRAMGMTRVVMAHALHRVTPMIDVADRLSPGEVARVTVDVPAPAAGADPAVIHLWAVDEGILDVTAYWTPDPFGHFLAPWRQGVETADLFSQLLPDALPKLLAHVGGDEDEEPARARRGPVASRRREPAVIWSAVRPVDAGGRARFELTMPEMTGEMRVMAVLVEGDHYGQAERHVTLAAPLMVEATWPRFLAPGDHVEIPVKLFNTTEAPLDVQLTMAVDGPVSLIDPPEKILVAPGRSERVRVAAEATGLGDVTVRLEASARDEAGAAVEADASSGETPPGVAPERTDGGPHAERFLSAHRTDQLVVRAPAPLHSVARTVSLQAGESLVLETPPELSAADTRLALSVGPSTLVDVRPAVERLIGYPYGCVEQTTSKLWILLAVPEVLPDEESTQGLRNVAVDMLAAGLVRLRMMQTLSGGLSYWPGGRVPHLWGSAYAAWFCVQAQRAGAHLQETFLDGLTDYLEEQLGRTGSSAPGENMRAFLCHVLAAFGRPQEGWMARLTERVERLDIAGRAHLAAAWLESGRRDAALEILRDDTLEQVVATATSARLTSQVSQEAVLLGTLLDLDPSHRWLPSLVTRIQQARVDECWYTTMENAMALAALARYQASRPDDVAFRGRVRAGDQTREFDQEGILSLNCARGVDRIELTSEGKGTIYVSLVAEGPRRDKVFAAYDRQLRVRRRWLDPAGEPIDLDGPAVHLHCGDLIQVEVTLEAPSLAAGKTVGNVALVDALPAGLEVENPRLATSAPAGMPKPVADLGRVEFLDDRVLIFTSARRQKAIYHYPLRVMSEGRFILPPIQASCMYDASFASVSGGGHVIVEP